jgi:hypothetical protein
LQVLAVATEEMKASVDGETEMLRRVPISTVTDLDEMTRDELASLVELLPEQDVIVAINPRQRCCWTSAELPALDTCPVRGAAWLRRDLEGALSRVLMESLPHEDRMDEG